jgi:peptidoglycan/xylan/chitin deacetylase (PgdA/CDA1 family)
LSPFLRALRGRLDAVPEAARPFLVAGLLVTLLVATASVANAVRPTRHGPAGAPAVADGLASRSPLEPVPAWAAIPAAPRPGTPDAVGTQPPSPPPTRTPSTPPSTPAAPSTAARTAPAPRPSATGPARPTPTRTAPPAPRARVSQIVTGTAHRRGRYAALTFDDGPTPEYTPRVLALLREHRVKAVFCIVGIQAREHPDLVRRIVADGHLLCNHTMTHDMRLPHKPVSVIRTQMRQAEQAIHRAAPGAPIPYYRAPGGAWSTKVERVAAGMGMKSLGWSVDTRDWERPGTQRILAHVSHQLRPTGVILMHDGGGDRGQTIAALERLLVTLPAAGYRFDVPA